MTDDAYFFDTYAIIEIVKGNPKFMKYVGSQIIITEFILAELCLSLIRELGIQKSFYYVDKYSQFVVPVNKEIIKRAMMYRFENSKKNVSMTDCIGYFLSKDLGMKFLTGDKEFKNMKNVEFVTKD